MASCPVLYGTALYGVLNKMMSEKQLREKVNYLKRELAIYEEILNTKKDGSMGRPKGSVKYTDEQVAFLRKNKDVLMKELILMFNLEFKTNYPPQTRALYNFMCREGILEYEERK